MKKGITPGKSQEGTKEDHVILIVNVIALDYVCGELLCVHTHTRTLMFLSDHIHKGKTRVARTALITVGVFLTDATVYNGAWESSLHVFGRWLGFHDVCQFGHCL